MGIMDVSQLPESLVDKICLPVFEGDSRQPPRAPIGTLSAFLANMVFVYFGIIPVAKTNNTKSGILD